MAQQKKLLVINSESGLERFIGNKKLYRDYEEFCSAAAMENIVMADEALHTLIGTSANLSLDRLHTVASEAALKLKMSDSPDKIQAIVDMVSEAYNEACIAVRKYLESAD